MDTVVLMWTTFIVSLVEFEVLFYEVFLLVIKSSSEKLRNCKNQ